MNILIPLSLNLFVSFFFCASLFSLESSAERGSLLQERLKTSVVEAETRLHLTQPWQKIIFNEEVVPGYSQFIRYVRSSGEALAIDVQIDAIKKYLFFYAPSIFQKPVPLAFILLAPAQDCSKCLEERQTIQSQIQSLLARRGLSVQLLKLERAQAHLFRESKSIYQELQTILNQKQGDIAIFLQWRARIEDAGDSAHADGIRYDLKAFVAMNDKGRIFNESLKNEIASDESFSTTYEKIVGNLFSVLGEKWALLDQNSLDVGEEVLLEVSGFQDFSSFFKLKLKIEGVLNEMTPVGQLEERKLSRGRVVFAVKRGGLLSELKEKISKVLEAEPQWIVQSLK